MDLGRLGIWDSGFSNDVSSAVAEIHEAAAELEELGYGTIWLGANPAVRHAVPLLEATSRIAVASSIVNIWQHDAADVAAQQAAIAADHPGRFLLGLGASHSVLVPGYHKPYSTMVGYLDRLDAAGSRPEDRVLAALGPRMLTLARERSVGAHPYLVTPKHTATAREILGQDALLAPEMKVVLDEDPDRARAAARAHFAYYSAMPNYHNNLMRVGFTEEDLADGGSDRLIDAIFVWGGVEAVRQRAAEHWEAGADHVAIHVVTAFGDPLPRAQWRAIAAGLKP
jgi:probable F420-dependent oxidoreductase